MKIISKKIISIANDNLSGSAEICLKLAKALKIEINKLSNKKKLKQYLSEVERLFKTLKSDMAIIVSFFKHLKTSLDDLSVNNLLKVIDGFIYSINSAPIFIAKKMQLKFKKVKKVMTYSASSTVEKVVKELKKAGFLFDIIVCESSPSYEGKNLAQRFVKARISTIFTSDAFAFSNIAKVDAILTGTDMVGEKFFRNKAGSKALFELADYHNIESYVLCEKYKVISNFKRKIEVKYTEENKYLKTLHPDFEDIPISLVKNFIIY